MSTYEEWEETGEWTWKAWTLQIEFPTLMDGTEMSEGMEIAHAAAQAALDAYLEEAGILCDCCIADRDEANDSVPVTSNTEEPLTYIPKEWLEEK